MSKEYDEEDFGGFEDGPDDADLDALSDFDEAEAMRKHEEVMEVLERIEEAIETGFKNLGTAISTINEVDEGHE